MPVEISAKSCRRAQEGQQCSLWADVLHLNSCGRQHHSEVYLLQAKMPAPKHCHDWRGEYRYEGAGHPDVEVVAVGWIDTHRVGLQTVIASQ